jgi:hypothetical protein
MKFMKMHEISMDFTGQNGCPQWVHIPGLVGFSTLFFFTSLIFFGKWSFMKFWSNVFIKRGEVTFSWSVWPHDFFREVKLHEVLDVLGEVKWKLVKSNKSFNTTRNREDDRDLQFLLTSRKLHQTSPTSSLHHSVKLYKLHEVSPSWNSTNFMKFHQKVHELHESPKWSQNPED